MIEILVTGANGQLGNELQKIAPALADWKFYFTDVDTLDITSSENLVDFAKDKHIGHIINCAAYTAVDKAENDEANANRINALAVKNLVQLARLKDAQLFHVSTDYVFDGNDFKPYMENHPVNPVSAYGRTKLAGENEALLWEKSYVIRTSWLYAASGNNFVKTMLKLGTERPEIKVIFDQVGTPTFAGDLAKALLNMIKFLLDHEVDSGIYHYSNEGVCSWYDFACEIMQYAGLKAKVIPIESWEFPSVVKRPFYSVLNKAKIKRDFQLEIPHWKTSLIYCLNELIHSKN